MQFGPHTGRRIWLLSAAGIAAISVIGTSLVVAQASDSAQPPDQAEYAGLMADESETPQPAAAQLAASENEHADLSDDAALEVAEQEFSNVLEAQLIPELELPADQEIDKFFDPYTARISDGDWQPRPDSEQPNPNLLVEGTLPLRAPEAGEPALLDADLVADGDHFEAANPIVTAEIGAEIDEGVELPEAGVAVAPLGVAAAEAEPVADKLFYPNAATDTDYLIAPTATGAQIFAQLRSADSPESLPLEIGMPAGAALEPTAEGGAIVRDAEGEPLASISAPVAWDAAGRQVAIEYAISGEQITMQVPHTSAGEFLYPIMVDPVVDQYNWGQGQQNLDHELWWWQTTNANDFNPIEDASPGAGGLRTNARKERTYAAGSYGQWIANSIRDSWIERIDFFNFDHDPTSPGACTTLGIWMPDQFQWAPVTIQNPAGGTTTGSYANLCGALSHQTRSLWVGNSPTPDGPYGDAEPYDHAMGIFALNSQGGYRAAQASNLLRSAYVYRYDRNKPWMTWNNVPSGWTKDPLLFDVHDVGLGVSGVWLFAPNWTVPATGTTHCSGAHQSVCPVDARVPVYPPEGKHSLTAVGMDPILNGSPGFGFTVRADRTAPHVPQPTGSLVVSKDDIRADQSYTLSVSATDGSTASPAQMQSGVKRLAIYVDDEEQPREEWTQECSDPDGSCGMATKTWTLTPGALSPGIHSVRVVATDAAGNSNPLAAVIPVTIQPDTAEPTVDLSFSAPAADGSVTATVHAADPGPGASGVKTVELYVDEERIAELSSGCSGPSCGLTRTVQLSASQSPALRSIDAVGADHWGNLGLREAGVRRSHQYFGYNDEFGPVSVDAAANGAASLIRFPVNWCGFEHSPDDFAWGRFDAIMADVKRRGATGMPVFYDSPPWANGAAGTQGDCLPEGTPGSVDSRDVEPPDDIALDDWREMIRAFIDRYGDPSSPHFSNLGAIEAWNEPNFEAFWKGAEFPNPPGAAGGEPRKFARLVEEAAAAARNSAKPNVKVLAGGLSPVGVPVGPYMRDAIDPAYDHRIRAADIDAVSIHLYPRNEEYRDDRTRGDVRAKYDAMIDGLWIPGTDTNHRDEDRWITEIGFPSGSSNPKVSNATSVARQRQRLRVAYRDYLGPKVKAFVVHRLVDGDPALEHHFGVIDRQGAIKGGTNGAYCTLGQRHGSPVSPPC